jgi:YihY family inner membrane protein
VFSLTHTIRRARQEKLLQVAGSLSFTTLLSVVPFLAVSFALFNRFPVLSGVSGRLESDLLTSLLPADIARTVITYLHRFSANGSGLTWIGLLFLLATALAMLLTVENAFNRIWNVKRTRPFPRRMGLYLLMLLVAPPVLGASLWAWSYLLGLSMGVLGPVPKSASFALSLGPAALNWIGLASLFHYLPNATVRWRDAMWGGLIASVLLELGKRGFATYVLKIPTYKALYGAFAVLPVFLLWVYFSWLATLTAGLIAANLGAGARSRSAARR